MKIFLPFDLKVNFSVFLRRAGYAEIHDYQSNKTSYVRRLNRDYYPRFHLYIGEDNDQRTFFNLHLDQKKPSYAGSAAHNAEYEGTLVETEGRRIDGLVKNELHNRQQIKPQPAEPISFWKKLFK
jgi:hypothetical protein